MKSDSNIKHKLKQVRFRHTKHEIEDLLSPSPANCVYNNGEGDFHKCSLQDQPLVICDKRYGGLQVAESCPNFQAKYSKEEIKSSLSDFFLTSSIPEIARRYPDMAALLWVLGDPEDRTDLLGDEETTSTETTSTETTSTETTSTETTSTETILFLPSIELTEATRVAPETLWDRFYNLLVTLKLIPSRLTFGGGV